MCLVYHNFGINNLREKWRSICISYINEKEVSSEHLSDFVSMFSIFLSEDFEIEDLEKFISMVGPKIPFINPTLKCLILWKVE